LGDGYSSILVDNKILFTQYRKNRRDQFEFSGALDAQTGRIIWEHRVEAPLSAEDESGWGGMGPNSTPLIVDHRLYTLSSCGLLHCFDKRTGEVLWVQDLVKSFHGITDSFVGYSPSPIAYNNLIIVVVTFDYSKERRVFSKTEENALIAFDRITGTVVWRNFDFNTSESSPIIIHFEREDQLVLSTNQGLLGVSPVDGKLLWLFPTVGSIITPVWNGKDTLYYSGGTNASPIAVKLTKEDGKTIPTKLWSNHKVNAEQTTPVLIGDFVYGASSNELYCVDINTGKLMWLEPGYPMATCVYGDDKLITLDVDGHLKLLKITSEKPTLLSGCKVTRKYSFTAPTLVGDVLYVRDRNQIMALDLGADQSGNKQSP